MSHGQRSSQSSTASTYYQLTKPGIIYGNCLSAAAGFFVASQRQIDWLLLPAALAGIALVIASGCVFNNYLDRGIDRRMDRTKQRALANGTISSRNALLYATLLAILGFSLLGWFTNLLTVSAGLLGLIVYVVAYGITKRRGPFGTVVGSIAGATPILAGYTAVSGQLDVTAGLLFLALALWQMPHFYAIAIYRLDDYRAAGIPVLPAIRGLQSTKIYIITYIGCFIICTGLLYYFSQTGHVFLLGMLTLCGYWLWQALSGWQTAAVTSWARQIFRTSLLVLLGFCALLTISPWLP